ncbi:DNA injection protein [Caudoviricetes sp.]|nr:DNA injection protein [Caudoviricetes sp.]
MPTFEITAPDGKTYEVTGPEGSTAEQALAKVKEQLGASTKPSEPSMLDKAKGVGEAGLSMLSAIPAAVAGSAAGVYQTVTGGKFGTPEGIRQGEQRAQEVMRNMTYQPRTAEGQNYLQNVSNVVDQTKIAGLGPTEAMALAGTAGPAIQQVKAAAAPLVDAATNIPVGSMVKNAVLPMPKPEIARLAYKAQALDIPLRPDMLSDNKFLRMMGEAFEKVPLSGSREDARRIAFNRALTAQIGGDANAQRLTPDVFKGAMDASGGKIGDIAKKTPIRLDAESVGVLDSQVVNAEKFSTDTIAKIVRNYVGEIKNKAANGEVNGEAFRKIDSQIGARMRGTSDGDLKMALSDLQDSLHDLLAKNVKNPEDISALDTARRQYAIGKTLEPLVAKSPNGNISPAALMGAVTNTASKKSAMARGGGDIGDLARIGQLFLKEPTSSGTAERSLVYGALGGGAAMNPGAAAGVWGAANAYNRAGPSIVSGILRNAPQEILSKQ